MFIYLSVNMYIFNYCLVLNLLLYFLRKENYAFDCKQNVTTKLSGIRSATMFSGI
jgi:hypothetical protein